MTPETATSGSIPRLSYGGGLPTAATAVTYKLLGPLEIWKDGRDHAPTAPKILQLLAMLLLHPGKIVHIESIIGELWPGGPPRSVRTTMQTYVYQLRKCIEWNHLAPDANDLLITRPPGYLLKAAPAQVDVFAFQQLCQRGRDLLDHHEQQEAVRCFRMALGLWSGSPLANVPCGSSLSAYVVDLQEQRRNALHLCIQSELERGMHRDLIGELRSLVTTNPLDESLHGLLMRALSASGRRSDALAAYRHLRSVLNRELGVEPCEKLQRLHRELLSFGEPAAPVARPPIRPNRAFDRPSGAMAL